MADHNTQKDISYLITNGKISMFLEQKLNYYHMAIVRGQSKCCAVILYTQKDYNF